jgi:hypothetical protein
MQGVGSAAEVSIVEDVVRRLKRPLGESRGAAPVVVMKVGSGPGAAVGQPVERLCRRNDRIVAALLLVRPHANNMTKPSV